jgi:hypothetical protein
MRPEKILFRAATGAPLQPAVLCVPGRNGGGNIPSSTPSKISSNSSPRPAQHLYVANGLTQQVLQYALPLTSASTPSTMFTTSGYPLSVAIDSSGNLAVGDTAGNLYLFRAPLSSASTASATLRNGSTSTAGQLLFTSAGDLFAASVSSAHINVFSLAGGKLSQQITAPALVWTEGIALDARNNLIVANIYLFTNKSNLVVFAPPLSRAESPILTTPVQAEATYTNLALSPTQLFVVNVGSSGSGSIDVYPLPLTASSTPAFSIITGSRPGAVALDSSGNLYVGTKGGGGIQVFTPPFSAASTPSVTLPMNADIISLAIGK